jgi:hypothetical protein
MQGRSGKREGEGQILPETALESRGYFPSRYALSILYAALATISFNLRLDCFSREPARDHRFRSALYFFEGWSVGSEIP